jgi:serine/threonine protein kinase
MEKDSVLGNYRIVEPIAAGGMGVVYVGEHSTLGRRVAIKVLMESLALSDKVRRRFEQEAYVQAQLEHPHIVRVQDFVQEGNTLAIVMDFVKGPSLAQYIAGLKGPLPVDALMHIMDPVIEAVAYAHERGIVHRDIKPGNVLLDQSGGSESIGIPKVTDFGLAKILADTEQHTKTGSKMGTFPYMAPEQFQGLKEIGPQADLYALAMMAWHLLAGQMPINTESMQEVLELYTGVNPFPNLPALNPDISQEVEDAILEGLAQQPGDRPESVVAWWAKVKQALGSTLSPQDDLPKGAEASTPDPAPIDSAPVKQPTTPPGSSPPLRPTAHPGFLSPVTLCSWVPPPLSGFCPNDAQHPTSSCRRTLKERFSPIFPSLNSTP